MSCRPQHGEKREHWVELRSPGLLEHLLLYIMELICNFIFKLLVHGHIYIGQAGLELGTQLEFLIFPLLPYLLSAQIMGMYHYIWLLQCRGLNPGLHEHSTNQATCPAPLNHHLENSHAQICESHSDFLQLNSPLFFYVKGNPSLRGGKLCPKSVVPEMGLELNSCAKSFFFFPV